jgi:hypothetical protein
VPIRVADTTLAAVVAPVCLCSHQRVAHFGGRCICCDGECLSWRPAEGRRHAIAQAIAAELRKLSDAEVRAVSRQAWVAPRRYCPAPRRLS